MLRVILNRMLWSIPLLLVVTALSFLLISFVPGNPAQAILGPYASEAQVHALSNQLGLNSPVWVQYWTWLHHALEGNLGTSLSTGQSVASLLSVPLKVSLTLVVIATLFAAVVGVSLGVIAATRGGWISRAVEFASVLGLALPGFWFGLILIELFAVDWKLLPPTGFVNFSQSVSGWAEALIMPSVTLSLAGITVIAAQTRDAMLEVLGREFVRVMRANGLSRRSIIYRHALRNAAIPVMTIIGITFVGLLGGSVVVESVFGLPGLGSQLTTAAGDHDIPVLEAIVLYFTVAVIAANLLLDLAYGLLNPKVRAS
jgi:peptide/nickel transport system permease protein